MAGSREEDRYELIMAGEARGGGCSLKFSRWFSRVSNEGFLGNIFFVEFHCFPGVFLCLFCC